MIKIHGEHTRPTDAPTLCETCQSALIVRGTRYGDDFVHCAAVEPPIVLRFTVTSCTAYGDKRIPTRAAYNAIGWVWTPDVDQFVSPHDDVWDIRAARTAPGFWARLRAVFKWR